MRWAGTTRDCRTMTPFVLTLNPTSFVSAVEKSTICAILPSWYRSQPLASNGRTAERRSGSGEHRGGFVVHIWFEVVVQIRLTWEAFMTMKGDGVEDVDVVSVIDR